MAAAHPVHAAEEAAALPEGRHRLDLSVTTLDAREADIVTVLPGYTYTLNNQVRVGVTGSFSYLDSHIEELSSGSGWGDTTLAVQYDPSHQITSSPWIPDTVGVFASVTAPTGDDDKGLSADAWSYSLGLGWAFEILPSLALVPGFAYGSSFSEGDDAIETEFIDISMGLLWSPGGGIWLGYTPYFYRDLELLEWATDHTLIFGKMWPGGLGLSLEYGRLDRYDSGARRDDYTGLINFYYQFGRK